MIFVTVGASPVPFDRLMEALDELPSQYPIVAQCGASTVRPGRATCFDYLDFEAINRYVRDADVVIAHAGVGSVMTARAGGKTPIVVPRLVRYGEAVDDHQLTFARRLAEARCVQLVERTDELAGAVVRALSPDAADGSLPAAGLADEIRSFLAETLGPPRKRG